ncbi:MAG: D-alanyl-D-alanine carboxypeptidase [Butyricicoccus pullicaecorum]
MCLFLVLLCGRAGAMSAQSAVVIDADTGEVRYEHNADAVLPMASTTKIMTAIVAIEQGDIDRTYTVKPEYTQTEGSSMYLKPEGMAFGIPCISCRWQTTALAIAVLRTEACASDERCAEVPGLETRILKTRTAWMVIPTIRPHANWPS